MHGETTMLYKIHCMDSQLLCTFTCGLLKYGSKCGVHQDCMGHKQSQRTHAYLSERT